MKKSALKNKLIEAFNESIDLESKREIFLCFRTHLSGVLKNYPTTKPLEWRMLQSQKGEQAITSFGSYCIARTFKGIEISNTFPGYRTAPKQYAKTVEEAKDICQKDLSRRISELLG